jgi:hypothetical protein
LENHEQNNKSLTTLAGCFFSVFMSNYNYCMPGRVPQKGQTGKFKQKTCCGGALESKGYWQSEDLFCIDASYKMQAL